MRVNPTGYGSIPSARIPASLVRRAFSNRLGSARVSRTGARVPAAGAAAAAGRLAADVPGTVAIAPAVTTSVAGRAAGRAAATSASPALPANGVPVDRRRQGSRTGLSTNPSARPIASATRGRSSIDWIPQ